MTLITLSDSVSYTNYHKNFSKNFDLLKNITNIKLQLENDNKIKEEKILNLERQNKEITMNYKKKLNEMDTNFSSEKSNVLSNYKEQLTKKEEEIMNIFMEVIFLI